MNEPAEFVSFQPSIEAPSFLSFITSGAMTTVFQTDGSLDLEDDGTPLHYNTDLQDRTFPPVCFPSPTTPSLSHIVDPGVLLWQDPEQHLPLDFGHPLFSPMPLSASSLSPQPQNEEIITQIVNGVRKNNLIACQDSPFPQPPIRPQVTKRWRPMKSIEADLRLLDSEAGKSLNSAEISKIRKRISASNCRKRNREHITELEDCIATKDQENKDLHFQNHAVVEENARLAACLTSVLHHSALAPFLEDILRGGDMSPCKDTRA